MKTTQPPQRSTQPQNRRTFLGRAGAVAAAALQPVLRVPGGRMEAAEYGPLRPEERRDRAYQIRLQTAIENKNVPEIGRAHV